MVEGSLFAIIDLLLSKKSITLCFKWGVGDDFTKNLNLKKNYFLHLIFSCYYCSADLKRQSEHLGPRHDLSSLVVI